MPHNRGCIKASRPQKRTKKDPLDKLQLCTCFQIERLSWSMPCQNANRIWHGKMTQTFTIILIIYKRHLFKKNKKNIYPKVSQLYWLYILTSWKSAQTKHVWAHFWSNQTLSFLLQPSYASLPYRRMERNVLFRSGWNTLKPCLLSFNPVTMTTGL